MCRRKSKMLHGICDLLRGECEMPHEICDFAVEMRNAAQNLGFPTQKKRNAARNSGSSHGECEIQCGFAILRVESAKAVQNSGIFRGKCEMLTEPGIFCGENTKCRAGFSIFCPERTKIRSGFAILSLAAAKSP